MDAVEFTQIMFDQAKQIQENQRQLNQIKFILYQLQAGLPHKDFEQRAATCSSAKLSRLNTSSRKMVGLIEVEEVASPVQLMLEADGIASMKLRAEANGAASPT